LDATKRQAITSLINISIYKLQICPTVYKTIIQIYFTKDK